MKLLIELNQEQLDQLRPSLQATGIDPAMDLVAVEWESPRNKKAVYQVATGDALETMTAHFNEFLENEGADKKLRNPADLNEGDQWRLLEYLNNNAEWDPDGDMGETWLKGDADTIARDLNQMPEITAPAE